MIIVSFVSIVVGVAFFCWLLYTLAAYALPFFAGLSAGLAAFHSGSGVIGSIIVGVLAGGATLAIGQIVFAMPLLRAVIGLLYAVPAAIAGYHATLGLAHIGVPAAIAGYHATLGLAHIGVPSEGWREAFAVVGAMSIRPRYRERGGFWSAWVGQRH
jgi:hypothetical protein